MPAPDFFQPQIGWRAWLVLEADEGLRLSSVMYRTLWRPRQVVESACRPRLSGADGPIGLGPHAAPDLDCACGIYAARDPGEAARYLSVAGPAGEGAVASVIGRVALWGKVVEGATGWRAASAYPEQLFVPERGLVPRLRLDPEVVAVALLDYGVPIVLLDAPSPRRLTEGLAAAA